MVGNHEQSDIPKTATSHVPFDNRSTEVTAPALFIGNNASITGETGSLLQRRLRRVAGILFLAILIFLARDYLAGSRVHTPFLWTLHVVTVLALGVCFLELSPSKPRGMWYLLAAEKVTFGFAMVLLLLMQRQVLLLVAARGFPHDPIGPWLILMLAYGLFIPTTLYRATFILGAMAVAPLCLVGGGMWLHPSVRAVWDYESFSRLTLSMFFGAGALLYGTVTIGTLRKEAIQAKRLGQYWLKEKIGAGGMGEVYLAEHQLLKRRCAIKIIPPSKATDPTALARFEREVRTTATLSHNNTVEIYDFGCTDEGVFYYVMEYLEGMNLADLVNQHGPLPASRVVHLLRQVCGALHEAHSIGFVHRDVKPANIFASVRGGVYDMVKLLDFGLVKSLTPDNKKGETKDGAITGSPLFMSPEQVSADHGPDARTDIYSLGAVGYFLLTGRPPFEGANPLKVLVSHLHDTPKAPSQWVRGLSADIETIILKCLAKNPADRFQSVDELSKALGTCQDASSWSSEHAEQWWQKRVKVATDPTATFRQSETLCLTQPHLSADDLPKVESSPATRG